MGVGVSQGVVTLQERKPVCVCGLTPTEAINPALLLACAYACVRVFLLQNFGRGQHHTLMDKPVNIQNYVLHYAVYIFFD